MNRCFVMLLCCVLFSSSAYMMNQNRKRSFSTMDPSDTCNNYLAKKARLNKVIEDQEDLELSDVSDEIITTNKTQQIVKFFSEKDSLCDLETIFSFDDLIAALDEISDDNVRGRIHEYIQELGI